MHERQGVELAVHRTVGKQVPEMAVRMHRAYLNRLLVERCQLRTVIGDVHGQEARRLCCARTEPVLEACRSKMRVAARNEGLLVQFCAKVTGVDTCDDLTGLLGCAQESAGDFLETEPLWTSYVDNTVYWRAQCDIDQHGSNVVRQDGLDTASGHATVCPSVGN